ncbi:MAG TPA: hypothetical protein VF189_00520, partial [Patescibacteria group bacterium]
MRLRTYILVILFIGIALFSKGLFNGFVGDDDLQIQRNIKVHSFTNLPLFFSGSTYENGGAQSTFGLFYRPIMMTSFSLIYSIFGPNPFFFHLFQISLHILNTFLLFLFLRYLFKDKIAFLLSLVFLVHPINSEAVLYSANLQEVLFFFFGIIALLILQRSNSIKGILLVSLSILFSFFSKESGILFLLSCILYSYIFPKSKNEMKVLLGYLLSAFGVYLFFRYVVAHMYTANSSLAPISHASLLVRLQNIPSIIFYYLKMFFFPLNIGGYEFWIVRSINFANFWYPLLVVVIFLALIVCGFLWVIKKYPKNSKLYLLFMFWFGIGLLLHIQIIPLDATVADRWFYFPIVGLLGMIGIILSQIYSHIKSKKVKVIWWLGISLIILALAVRTFIRIGDWHDPLTLYSYDIKNSPSNFILDNAYGQALIKNNYFHTARIYLERSVKEHPYSANLNNLAIVYAAIDKKDLAEEYFKKAIIAGQNFSVYENYANFLMYFESQDKALAFAKEGVKIFPESPVLWQDIALIEYNKGDKKNALYAIARSYKLSPTD